MNKVFNKLVDRAVKDPSKESSIDLDGLKVTKVDNGITIAVDNHSYSINQSNIGKLLSLLVSVDYKDEFSDEEIADELYYDLQSRWRELPSYIKHNHISFSIDNINEYIIDRFKIDYYELNDDKLNNILEIFYNKYGIDVFNNKYRDYNTYNIILDHITYSMGTSYKACNIAISYNMLCDYINTNRSTYSKDNHWIKKYIPASGASALMSAEIISTCNYILYRYYNDGDTALYWEDANLIPFCNLILYLNSMNTIDKVEFLYYVNKVINELRGTLYYVDVFHLDLNDLSKDYEAYKKSTLDKESLINKYKNYIIINEIADRSFDIVSSILLTMYKILDNDKLFLSNCDVIDLRTNDTFNNLMENCNY